jgi:GNAT superfamily N-acetyltransferase
MKYQISDLKKDLTAEAFIDISQSVGWGKNAKYDMKKVKQALKNTSYIVTVKNKGLLIGCGRALSDDLLFTTVPDLFVRPEFQKQGIGKIIMEKIIKKFSHTKIFFGSQPGNELFFEKLGFKKDLQSYSMKRES